MKAARKRRKLVRFVEMRDNGLDKLVPTEVRDGFAVYEINLADFIEPPDVDLIFEQQLVRER